MKIAILVAFICFQLILGCKDNEDCIGLSVDDIPLPLCHPKYEICVHCISDEFCRQPKENGISYCNSRCIEGFCIRIEDVRCFGREFCYEGGCVECIDSSQCSNHGNRKYCHPETQKCVECVDSIDCRDGEICNNNRCDEPPISQPGVEPPSENPVDPPSETPVDPPSETPVDPPVDSPPCYHDDKELKFSLCYTFSIRSE